MAQYNCMFTVTAETPMQGTAKGGFSSQFPDPWHECGDLVTVIVM